MQNWIDFKIPDDWQIIPIKEIATKIRSGGTPSRRNLNFWNGDIRFGLIEDITSAGTYLSDTKERITLEGLSSSSAWLVPAGAVLLSMYATIGATTINSVPLATNQAILAIVPKPEISPEYLAFALRAHKSALAARNVQATQKNINKGIVETFPIPIPPFAEQRRIAHVISTLQSAIEQQERLIVLTRELKSALMKKLFTEGLRGENQKETEIGLVPESWEVSPLDGLLERTQYGLSLRGASSGKCGILRMTNQKDGRISPNDMQFVDVEDGVLKKYRLEKGDLLFNRTNSFELVGRTAIFDIDGEYVFASYLIRLTTVREYLNPFYLNHYLNWDVTQQRLKSIATRAVSQSNISATRLRTFEVPIPRIDEQIEIIQSIDTLDKKLALHQRTKELHEELFAVLLHQLMTAQIRVNDIELPGLN